MFQHNYIVFHGKSLLWLLGKRRICATNQPKRKTLLCIYNEKRQVICNIFSMGCIRFTTIKKQQNLKMNNIWLFNKCFQNLEIMSVVKPYFFNVWCLWYVFLRTYQTVGPFGVILMPQVYCFISVFLIIEWIECMNEITNLENLVLVGVGLNNKVLQILHLGLFFERLW